MNFETNAEVLAARIRQAPAEPEPWIELARLVGRTRVVPDLPADPATLAAIWGRLPDEAGRLLLLAAVAGLEVLAAEARAPGRFWERTGRLGRDQRGWFDSATGAPLHLRLPALDLHLSWIPPGSFMMGQPPDAEPPDWQARPQHLVSFARGFWIGTFPLTRGQWAGVTGFRQSHFYESDLSPVESVNLREVRAFLRALPAKVLPAAAADLDLCRVRLPSEAEWEYACGGGESWGAGPWTTRDLDRVAWYRDNSEGRPHPVGGKAPNPFGLFDMLGNVQEWCLDTGGSSDPHQHRAGGAYQGAPTDGTPWSKGSTWTVIRGGGWQLRREAAHSWVRGWNTTLSASWDLGLRVVFAPGPHHWLTWPLEEDLSRSDGS